MRCLRSDGLHSSGIIQGEELTAPTTRSTLPIPSSFVREEPRKITEEEREFQAYRTLRNERAAARHEGARKVREAKVRTFAHSHTEYSLTVCPMQKAEEEANKKK